MLLRKRESPVISVLVWASVGAVVYFMGVHQGVELRECPLALEDGRKLIGRDLRGNREQCKYEAIRRPALELSAEELYRMYVARKRMERVGPR